MCGFVALPLQSATAIHQSAPRCTACSSSSLGPPATALTLPDSSILSELNESEACPPDNWRTCQYKRDSSSVGAAADSGVAEKRGHQALHQGGRLRICRRKVSERHPCDSGAERPVALRCCHGKCCICSSGSLGKMFRRQVRTCRHCCLRCTSVFCSARTRCRPRRHS